MKLSILAALAVIFLAGSSAMAQISVDPGVIKGGLGNGHAQGAAHASDMGLSQMNEHAAEQLGTGVIVLPKSF